MAYASLVSLAQTTDLFLHHDKYSISVAATERVISIHDYVDFLIAFLANFPDKANRYEAQLMDVANETENTIEYFMWKQIQSRRKWVTSLTAGLSRAMFEHRLEKVGKKVGAIAREIMDIKMSFRMEESRGLSDLPAISSLRFESTGKNDVVIGLNDDLLAVKSWICGESSKLEVIPIVGMGGIGKTTLARSAYDDQLILEHFDVRAWITVSQDYSEEVVLSRLLYSMKLFEEFLAEKKILADKEKKEQQSDVSKMVEKAFKHLKGRRYLIVMDDVWSTKALDDVRHVFPDDGNGSRIMLTTRLIDVAAYADSCSYLHEMRFLNDDKSWNLLKQKLFTDGQDCPPELEDVGKEIARICGGLPLAVVLVAGILSTVNKTRASWEEFAESVNSVVDGQLEKILSLSYTHLPQYLRTCFLFIGGYPKDQEIHVSRLIKLWVAEGFIKRRNGYKSLEEEAEDYLEDLVRRSLVLVTRRKSNGKIKSCRLHDLVRDLCIRKAEEERFLLQVLDVSVPLRKMKSEQRICLSHSYLDQLAKISGPTIHTILCLQESDDASTSLAFVRSFRLLRVFDMVNSCFNTPPSSQVFELFHLRHIALCFHFCIPSTISNLENLQTLIIRQSETGTQFDIFFTLPSEIWRMSQLRHLVSYHACELPDPREDGSILPLQNLQTLSPVLDLVLSEDTLKMLPNLKKLWLVYCRILSSDESQLDNLTYLHQLQKLKITMNSSFWSWRKKDPAFPATLKKLTLVGGLLPWEDMTIVGSLPNLEVLKLIDRACYGGTWELSDGEFLRLKFLLISSVDLQQWIVESSHFPRLKCLMLYQCLFLNKIPEGIGEIPTLEMIEVDDQNQFLVQSALQIQKDQQSYGNDVLQVHRIYADKSQQKQLQSHQKQSHMTLWSESTKAAAKSAKTASYGLVDPTLGISSSTSWIRLFI